jgi:hypothetical protein
MCGFCITEQFANTKAVSGKCELVHDEKMKAECVGATHLLCPHAVVCTIPH